MAGTPAHVAIRWVGRGSGVHEPPPGQALEVIGTQGAVKPLAALHRGYGRALGGKAPAQACPDPRPGSTCS